MQPQHAPNKAKFTISTTYKLPSGSNIPAIGYGTYQLKGDQCIEGVTWALSAGYKHIDTASIYKNQAEIAKSLKQGKIKREDIFITSKISPQQQGYKESRQAVQGILHRLQITYLDLILIHWPGVSKVKVQSQKNATGRLQTWKSFIQLQKQGKVKDIGVSNFLLHHLKHLLENTSVKPAVNQFQIHPMLWQGRTIQFCRQNGILIQAYSPLARSEPKLLKNAIILEISKKHKKTVAQICLRWSLQHGFIVLPKSSNKNRIQENIKIYDFELSAQQMEAINALKKAHIRTCWNPNTILH